MNEINTQTFLNFKNKIIENCSRAILGKDETITLVLTSFICSGHVLIEDIPGTGKTMLLRAFAKSIGFDFKRVQFTPDLLPSDILGINFYNQKSGEFEFKKGPLFSNIVLADEINRATPRTQSSLLEAMEEGQISIDGKTYMLDSPFMVMATQNPIESYGTFPLPDAQIDRFFIKVSMGYMKREEELEVISRASTVNIIENLNEVITKEETGYVKENYKNIKVSEDVKNYIMDIVEKTRSEESGFNSGVSARGSIALYKACQAFAALSGRDFVIPEDVKYLAPYVLLHRLGIGGIRTSSPKELFDEMLKEVKVPAEEV